MLGVEGELPATVLMLLTPEDAEKICVMLGLEPHSDLAPSALGEIGNVVGTSYLNALAGMTGLEIEPTPPATVTDFLGAIVESVLAVRAAASDRTLLLDSSLVIEGEDCSIVFLLVPDHGGAEELLERIGVVMSDLMARMGELCASGTPGDSLVALGLGSCIGLVLLDRRKGVAGLAHIVLPAADGHGRDLNPLKFADKAVPELIRQVVALGGRKPMLEAIVVGGASMFAGAGSTLEVGVRNEAAVKAALAKARADRVHAEDTGGTKGRTVRVDPVTGVVTVRKAGAQGRAAYPQFPHFPQVTCTPGGGLRWPAFSSSTTPRSCARWCRTLWPRRVTK